MKQAGKIVILGAGPTGLGAFHRLQELGYRDVELFEKEGHAGGLASSFVDEQGFTWDIGGHVQFSHYTYFDQLMEQILGDQWIEHERESWIRCRERFIPYPFQYNVRHLPREEMLRCLRGVLHLAKNPPRKAPKNFREWILAQFGQGIAEIFMFPYNKKTWAYPPEDLDCSWMGERVASIDLERFVMNIVEEQDDISWGPNKTFRFPLSGGTGEIWRRLSKTLPQERLHFEHKLRYVDSKEKVLYFANGQQEHYDTLVSSIPLDLLVKNSDMPEKTKKAAKELVHSKVHIAGLGLAGKPKDELKKKCWMYFPENNCPFFRATVFSNYSPNNVPSIEQHWSLMLEVSESPKKPLDSQHFQDSILRGALAAKLIDSKEELIDFWYYRAEHGYPTPFLCRDKVLDSLLPALQERSIYSRGRFGAWRYEVSNQDHSLMQGVEVADEIVLGTPEETLFNADFVNSRKKDSQRSERPAP